MKFTETHALTNPVIHVNANTGNGRSLYDCLRAGLGLAAKRDLPVCVKWGNQTFHISPKDICAQLGLDSEFKKND